MGTWARQLDTLFSPGASDGTKANAFLDWDNMSVLGQMMGLARPVRLERTAFGSGGQRSIQLSYGRLAIP